MKYVFTSAEKTIPAKLSALDKKFTPQEIKDSGAKCMGGKVLRSKYIFDGDKRIFRAIIDVGGTTQNQNDCYTLFNLPHEAQAAIHRLFKSQADSHGAVLQGARVAPMNNALRFAMSFRPKR